MDQGSAAADGVGNVDGLDDLSLIAALLQQAAGVGVDAVGTLNRRGNGNSDQGLLPGGQGSVLEHGTVVGHVLVP